MLLNKRELKINYLITDFLLKLHISVVFTGHNYTRNPNWSCYFSTHVCCRVPDPLKKGGR